MRQSWIKWRLMRKWLQVKRKKMQLPVDKRCSSKSSEIWARSRKLCLWDQPVWMFSIHQKSKSKYLGRFILQKRVCPLPPITNPLRARRQKSSLIQGSSKVWIAASWLKQIAGPNVTLITLQVEPSSRFWTSERISRLQAHMMMVHSLQCRSQASSRHKTMQAH